jgi:UDP-3-O-[3-hydroxymyristoyl] glucosamine N-acyltransferase
MGSTIIRRGVKIDNLCQIGHNVEVGENTVMAGLSGIAGSAKVGKGCVIAGQSGIAGHITIADKTTLAAQSGIIGNVRKEGEALMGYPAISYRDYMRAYALFKASARK